MPLVTHPDTPEWWPQWWQGAAIYQIYPRSFLDTNGDGVGDLPGITAKMDYIAELGVDAIWISPFFPSPMADFGYDVAEYCDVDPLFGTLADFDALLAAAHARGLKVIIDQVYAHTAITHAWFTESRADRTNARHDWYVWSDPRPDGTPPNNWQSVFGGPAWTWDGRRRQYYLHTFLKEQPQLNVRLPVVQDALLGAARFWLERGVDGFRLDALNHSIGDAELRDNPPAQEDGHPRNRPFDFQDKLYSQSQPEVVGFVERIRALCNEFGVVFTVAEVGGGSEAVPVMQSYTAGDARLNSAYGFDFLYAPALTPALVAQAMAAWPGLPDAEGRSEGWPSWAFENHDAPRAISRWGEGADRDAFARMKVVLLAALRGNVILYQGEELGLEQDEIPFELLQDPEAIANWPLTLSRDGARTPLPWSAAPGGGFTTGNPWLPLSPENRARSVESQLADPASLLAFTRAVLAMRCTTPALRLGALSELAIEGQTLEFARTHGDSRILCRFNLGHEPAPHRASEPHDRILFASGGAGLDGLPAWSAVLIEQA